MYAGRRADVRIHKRSRVVLKYLGDSLIPCRRSSMGSNPREYRSIMASGTQGNARDTYAVLEACVIQMIYNGVCLDLDGGPM